LSAVALPKVCNVRHLRNPNFTGREEVLARLRKALTSGPAAITQAISGLGGIGKTQLAVEYIYRHAADYSIAWWVRAEDSATMAGDYADLAAALDLPEKNAADRMATVAAVRLWLARNPGWLLILDNASSAAECRDYLPLGGMGHVLVTSRDPNWGGVAQPLPLDVLPRNKATAFLQKRAGRQDRKSADRLCNELGDLPLALEQAAAYIEATGISIADYLTQFQRYASRLLKHRSSSSDYPDSVATTWKMSLDRMAPAATELLNLMAFLAPDDIDREMVSAGAARLPASLAAIVANPITFDTVIAELRRYSLVQVRDGALSVHRLVQAVTRGRLAAQDTATWAETAVQLVNDAFPFEIDVVETWSRSTRLLPHALAVCKSAEGLGVALETVARLLNQAGQYLYSRAQLADAAKVMEASLAIAEKVYGPDHPEVGVVANDIGQVLLEQRDLEGALRYSLRALTIDENVYGPDHPTVAIRANNIGIILKEQEDLEGALRHVQRALSIDEKVNGPDHATVARDANNLGMILQDQGNLEGALLYTQRALSIDERVYGPDHPNVAVIANNIGLILHDRGDLEGALRYTQRALSIDEKVYGPDHPNVGIRAHNIGQILKAHGDLEGALRYEQRAVHILQGRYGAAHPYSRTAGSNLAELKRLIASNPDDK
jgi:tetratricopeptide (TPR) repeat protein